MNKRRTFEKQPNDDLDYDVDMSEWFEFDVADEISVVGTGVIVSTTGEASPTLSLGPTPHPQTVLIGSSPTSFKMWVDGGTDGEDYKVTFLITTVASRKVEVEVFFRVRDK
jgi:hypothetical protein|tara:strand:+ start:8803 stop:9135 length:333 start_codon:yes stop_codon:yes gene_type:complete